MVINCSEKLLNSKYLIIDSSGWHLLPNAPNDIKQEFDEFMKLVNNEPIIEE